MINNVYARTTNADNERSQRKQRETKSLSEKHPRSLHISLIDGA